MSSRRVDDITLWENIPVKFNRSTFNRGRIFTDTDVGIPNDDTTTYH